MAQRQELLDKLLAFERPIEEIESSLAQFPWDSQKELSFLSLSHISNVLRRYVQGTAKASEVESWANAIEGRDDIGFDSGDKPLIRELLHELANPILAEPLTSKRATELLQRIGPISVP